MCAQFGGFGMGKCGFVHRKSEICTVCHGFGDIAVSIWWFQDVFLRKVSKIPIYHPSNLQACSVYYSLSKNIMDDFGFIILFVAFVNFGTTSTFFFLFEWKNLHNVDDELIHYILSLPRLFISDHVWVFEAVWLPINTAYGQCLRSSTNLAITVCGQNASSAGANWMEKSPRHSSSGANAKRSRLSSFFLPYTIFPPSSKIRQKLKLSVVGKIVRILWGPVHTLLRARFIAFISGSIFDPAQQRRRNNSVINDSIKGVFRFDTNIYLLYTYMYVCVFCFCFFVTSPLLPGRC